MKKFTIALLYLGFICAFSIYAQPGFTSNLLFVAKLVGEEEVPSVVTNAIGEANLFLNENRDSLCINITVKGLSGPITGAHIHEGPYGGIGNVAINFTNNVSGNRISTIITAPVLDNLFIANLFSGSFYINVHTANNPNGEIRGQIELESDLPFMAKLDGAQETPAVSTNASGLAVFDLSRSMISLKIKALFENLSGSITGCHLHSGLPGISGSVVADLMPGINGNRLDISIAPDSFLTLLMHGDIYINVHTAANPNGEIRGQLNRQRSMSFDANLNGTQETPPVTTSGNGLGLISFNSTEDTVWYDFVTAGLSAVPTAAHFHNGPPGVSGAVSINVSSSLSGNQLHGTIVGSNIPSGFIDNCLKGNVYLNFHTTAHSGGEVRGQLKRFIREGFTYSIDAAQETGVSTSSATGSGMASIDRDAEDLHFRMIIVGLTDTIVAAHFHNAPAGIQGATIFDINPYFTHSSIDDGAFNYWKSIDGFDSSKIALFLNNSVYVNIHTTQYPDGEVRGQIIHGSVCSVLNIGVAEIPYTMDFKVYPNPISTEALNISFDGLIQGTGKILIYDISGRIVYSNTVLIERGYNYISKNINLQPGMYMVKLQVENVNQFVVPLIKY